MSAVALSPRSALFRVAVHHERFAPRAHRFTYRLFYLALDLDELPQLGRRLRLLRINRRGLLAFREDDYFPFGPAGVSLKSRVLAWCAAQGHDAGPGARVVLVTLPRMFGYHFNPVSFYFCGTAAGEPLVAVAEVTNTFRETKPYLVPRVAANRFHARAVKEFYVSPFSSVDVAFDFTLRAPSERLAIRIDDYDGGRCTLHSTLVGARRPLTDAMLAWLLVRHPLLSLRVMGRIHWQAFRLWGKRVPHFSKTEAADRQRGFHARRSPLAHEH